MASGKTTLAFELAELLGGIRVGLDSYLHTDRDGTKYVDELRHSYLKSDLAKLKAAFSFVVVDGICLREALDKVHHTADLFVYVKRISKAGIWHDEMHLEDYESGECIPESWLQLNDLSYHLERRPHETAAITYERIEA